VSLSLGKQLPRKIKSEDPIRSKRTEEAGLLELDPNHLPRNTVAQEGSTVVLTCGVLNSAISHSVQWTEFAYNENGNLISDNDFILGHPEASRYSIINTVPGYYDLQISNVRLSDGGVYLCQDAQTSAALKRQHAASLTIMGATNCTTSIGSSGIVLDQSYQVNDCGLNYKGPIVPNMTWSGPGPFGQGMVATDNTVWSGMQFNVTRDMDTRAHLCTTFFTGYFLPVDSNFADNVPDYVSYFQNRQMFVYWGPTDVQASPIKVQYDAGDVLTCTADAFPAATYLWQNLRTAQIYSGSTVRIDESWRGYNQTMRCEARNTIESTIYSNNVYLPVDVAPLTTPPVTTPATTTTPPPAVSPCTDLTGAWVSTAPTKANLCIRLDLSNQGILTGLLKNGTDTYWVDIVGRAQSNKFDQVGFNGIWPINLGVSSFIGECHRCFGEEQLLVNVISRTKGVPCGTIGPTQYTSQYVFTRSQALQCPNLPNLVSE
jgi:hypothetical protein